LNTGPLLVKSGINHTFLEETMIQTNEHAEPWNKGRTLPPEPLTSDEAERLIRAASGRCPTGQRNRAMLVCMYRGGLRCQEVLDLMPKDVDTAVGTIRVLRGKGNKCRLVGIDSGAMAIIQRWLDTRGSLGFNGRQRMFCTLKGRPVGSRYVRSLLPRLAAKAGIDKRVHPHGLRHSHAAELANEGVPLHVIRQQLGHASLAVTDRYIQALQPADVIQAMQEREWGL
jgi:site-specific recombinase XerD